MHGFLNYYFAKIDNDKYLIVEDTNLQLIVKNIKDKYIKYKND